MITKTPVALLTAALFTACSADPARTLAPEVAAAPVSLAFTPGTCDYDRSDAGLTSAGWT